MANSMQDIKRHIRSVTSTEHITNAMKLVSAAKLKHGYLDPPAIGTVFPRALRFVAWDGLFRVPLFATLIRTLGTVPVSPENKNSADEDRPRARLCP